MQIKTIQILKIICLLLFLIPSMLLAQKNENAAKRSVTTQGLDFECAPCRIRYYRYNPINVGYNVNPNTFVAKLPVGGKLNLANRYVDIDLVRYKGGGCPSGVTLNTITPVEFLGHESRFEITVGMINASFDQNNIGVNVVNKGQIPIEPYTNPSISGNFHVYQSENAVLHVSPTWTSGDIEVEVDVLDNAPIPSHPTTYIIKGTFKDPDVLNHHKWTFTKDNNIPTDLKQVTGNPVEGAWTNMDPFGYRVDYDYRGVDSCALTTNNYFQHLVTENFPSSDVYFTLADLNQNWLTSQGITTLDQAIVAIFRDNPLNGPSASFLLDGNSQFTDTHGLVVNYNDVDLAQVVFNFPDALDNDKIGYYINQEYYTSDSANTQLGTAVISKVLRRVVGSGGVIAFHIKKDHNSICAP